MNKQCKECGRSFGNGGACSTADEGFDCKRFVALEEKEKGMKLVRLTTREQFENLKKDDLILVKWWVFFVRHHEGAREKMCYNIFENKARSNEIICRYKGNHYFNYELFLENRSNAEEVYLIEEE